jgi:hypothetical protein
VVRESASCGRAALYGARSAPASSYAGMSTRHVPLVLQCNGPTGAPSAPPDCQGASGADVDEATRPRAPPLNVLPFPRHAPHAPAGQTVCAQASAVLVRTAERMRRRNGQHDGAPVRTGAKLGWGVGVRPPPAASALIRRRRLTPAPLTAHLLRPTWRSEDASLWGAGQRGHVFASCVHTRQPAQRPPTPGGAGRGSHLRPSESCSGALRCRKHAHVGRAGCQRHHTEGESGVRLPAPPAEWRGGRKWLRGRAGRPGQPTPAAQLPHPRIPFWAPLLALSLATRQ